MGQQIEVYDAVLEYFEFSSFATPKDILRNLEEIFENYERDTLRRLIQRNLTRLIKEKKIVRYTITPYYHLVGNEPDLHFILAIRKRNAQFWDLDCPIKSASKGGVSGETFAEYFKNKHRLMK